MHYQRCPYRTQVMFYFSITSEVEVPILMMMVDFFELYELTQKYAAFNFVKHIEFTSLRFITELGQLGNYIF